MYTSIRVEPYACFPAGNHIVDMGAFSYSESELPLGTKVGRYCSIAAGLQIFRDRHPIEWVTTSSVNYDFAENGYRSFVAAQLDFNAGRVERMEPPDRLGRAPIIENDVWIGQNVQLARGITIGTGAVVAAGAVVTKDVEPYSIVAGLPAKRIRYRFDASVCQALLLSEWWRYDPSLFRDLDLKNPLAFVRDVNLMRDRAPYDPPPIESKDILEALSSVSLAVNTVES